MHDEIAMRKICEQEMLDLAATLAPDADFIIPCYNSVFFRLSKNAADGEMTRARRAHSATPTKDVHVDFTRKSFPTNLSWAMELAGRKPGTYRRIVAYQLWRALSNPPHDFPLVLADRRSIPSGHYLEMPNVLGTQHIPGGVIESGMALAGNHDWYYFPDLRQDEVIVFKGYDTACDEEFNLFHSSFDNTLAESRANPRASIEVRCLAFWR
jgi:hypothetical protein